MTIRVRYLALAGVLLLVLGYGAGRFTTPARVEERTVDRVIYQDRIVEKRVEVAASQTERVVNRVRTVTKEGAVRTETQVVYRDRTVTAKAEDVVRTVNVDHVVTQDRIVTASQPRWTLIGGVGASVSLQPFGASPTYLAAVQYRLLGPVSVGAFASFNQTALQPTVGVTVGVSF